MKELLSNVGAGGAGPAAAPAAGGAAAGGAAAEAPKEEEKKEEEKEESDDDMVRFFDIPHLCVLGGSADLWVRVRAGLRSLRLISVLRSVPHVSMSLWCFRPILHLCTPRPPPTYCVVLSHAHITAQNQKLKTPCMEADLRVIRVIHG